MTFAAPTRAPFSFVPPNTKLGLVAGVIQLVECQLPKLDVAGSSPVARSQQYLIRVHNQCNNADSVR